MKKDTVISVPRAGGVCIQLENERDRSKEEPDWESQVDPMVLNSFKRGWRPPLPYYYLEPLQLVSAVLNCFLYDDFSLV